ncbi:LacI family DNA-binding transcriptional regulator [Petroclostridium sp. X23]|uniref:LacI family DNA-binding transcriptional regulator n=1 Tax=Petroclostridium sp. X23 TaxID=3045146 RepID=UPI0024AE53DA|nr:LacI family DNA-binding transcriptional regulator [Petroclostridium sp. X23]WHH56938.1 LacI family DNA-binding transcriptional regulator [Petroclostridium sp. X23]
MTARSLVGKPLRIISLFIIDFFHNNDNLTVYRSPFYLQFNSLATDLCSSLGYNIMISIIREHNIDNIEMLLSTKTIAGAIIIGDLFNKDIVDRLVEKGYKLALHNQRKKSTSPNMIVVNYDNEKCGRMAAQFLVDNGHKKIGHITGDFRKISVADRFRGYYSVLAENNLTFDKRFFEKNASFQRAEEGYNAAMNIFTHNKNEYPSAIFCGSSILMVGVLTAITELGLKVPDDISLIGIDGIEMCKYTNPPLSEIHIQYEQISSIMVSKLIELVEMNEVDKHTFLLEEAEIVKRSSVNDMICK